MPGFKFQHDFKSIVFLELEDVDFFHSVILEAGEPDGYNRLDDLLGAVGRPKTNACYEDGTDLVRVAAYYWHGISTSHGYRQGNKRTAFVSAVNFLLMNGVQFEVPDKELGPWIERLFIENTVSVEILENTLRRHAMWL
ncbi:type II toxin-antitoxin system death-on-curing family toxin [Neptunicoccus sediminis]|uniref:type II toxin-antitoxin system death-on-curing family toxin n=1 Tax=Neptunicoccus sediminis TaxID=1892596 RepID=UPI000845C2F5|nr:type II toxin-antitoxin system death-on-curing family toxin [Neptunicoccus sediminis]